MKMKNFKTNERQQNLKIKIQYLLKDLKDKIKSGLSKYGSGQ